MNKNYRLAFSDLFGIAFIGGWVGAVVTALFVTVWLSLLSGLDAGKLAIFVAVSFFTAIVFTAFLLPILISYWIINIHNKLHWLRWFFFPIAGALAASALSVFTVFPAIQTTVVAGSGGLASGISCAWLFGKIHDYRLSAPAGVEAKGRLLFTPSWFTRN